MYPDAYEVGLPNQGVMILYEVINERPDALAERTYAVWPDMEAALREAGLPQFTVDGHRAVGDFDLLGLSASRPSSATPTCSPPSTSRASRSTPSTARWSTPSSSRVGTRRSTPSRSPTSSTRRSSATASRRCWRSPTSSPSGRQPGARAVGASCSCGSRAPAASTCPRSTTCRTCPMAGSSASPRQPTRPGVPWRVAKHTVMDLDAWPYPKQPLVPLAESVHERMSVEIFRGCTRGCRFCQAGMITRPVRERSITGIGEMVERGPGRDRLRGGGPALAVARRTTPRSPTSPRGSPTATRGRRPASRCPRRASTPSTSTSPTS